MLAGIRRRARLRRWPPPARSYFCLGHALHARRLQRPRSPPSASWSRTTLQILINTLSFARVGAFALAHAGLSSAIVALMDAADSLVAARRWCW